MTKLNVLHVEDEPNARLMLADLLGDEVALTSCESAEAGLERLRSQTFELTILDWTLPGLSGGEFLRLRTRRSSRGPGGRGGAIRVWFNDHSARTP